jgi:two-component system OmpR family sensor kinase
VKHAPGSRIALAVEVDAASVRVRVSDTGPGMPPEVAAHAFDAFYRADESRDRRSGGVGLGLSIVRGIVLAHGGEMTLETAPGRGTTLTARLPRERSVSPDVGKRDG